jgi:hypothetical protein
MHTLHAKRKTEMTPTTKHRMVTWDTADDVTELVDELNEAIASVFDGRQCPLIAAVNTGSDMFAVPPQRSGRPKSRRGADTLRQCDCSRPGAVYLIASTFRGSDSAQSAGVRVERRLAW